jgi:hypothetical protein
MVLASCGAIAAVKKIEHAVNANRATIDAFSSNLKSGAVTPFSATYETSGTLPATVVVSVDPSKGTSFSETPAAGSTSTQPISMIANSSGEYLCTKSTSTSTWSCQKLDPVSAANENGIFDLYTPSHWISFLQGLALVAGLAGDTVTSSTMTVNGFNLKCVDFKTSGQTGLGTICTTEQGLLGYVKVSTDSTSFAITSYTTSPEPSLFEIPVGATVSNVQTPGS